MSWFSEKASDGPDIKLSIGTFKDESILGHSDFAKKLKELDPELKKGTEISDTYILYSNSQRRSIAAQIAGIALEKSKDPLGSGLILGFCPVKLLHESLEAFFNGKKEGFFANGRIGSLISRVTDPSDIKYFSDKVTNMLRNGPFREGTDWSDWVRFLRGVSLLKPLIKKDEKYIDILKENIPSNPYTNYANDDRPAYDSWSDYVELVGKYGSQKRVSDVRDLLQKKIRDSLDVYDEKKVAAWTVMYLRLIQNLDTKKISALDINFLKEESSNPQITSKLKTELVATRASLIIQNNSEKLTEESKNIIIDLLRTKEGRIAVANQIVINRIEYCNSTAEKKELLLLKSIVAVIRSNTTEQIDKGEPLEISLQEYDQMMETHFNPSFQKLPGTEVVVNIVSDSAKNWYENENNRKKLTEMIAQYKIPP